MKLQGKKKLGYFRFNFWGVNLRLFSGVECFPEPVRIVVVPQTRRLKDIMESSEVATSKRHNVLLISESTSTPYKKPREKGAFI